ncbi:hypothetical protein NPIL_520321 [Nephila pilipes]|uniref:Uncharacterized protein n=1 Tax=Nephila pilipes TaxID=299642 RepID=A0A8X6ND69_NEPPI|nr:hypothetical protein NPIL_520321 [Nephila pilipes]
MEWKMERDALKMDRDVIKMERDGDQGNCQIEKNFDDDCHKYFDVITWLVAGVPNHESPIGRTAVVLQMYPKKFLKNTGFEPTLERNGTENALKQCLNISHSFHAWCP